MKDKIVVVFDLDDTLIKEIDYLKSAYREIANLLRGGDELFDMMLDNYFLGRNVFEILIKLHPDFSVSDLLNVYRNHLPKDLHVSNEVRDMLNRLKKAKIVLGVITDGRTITQKNKLKATGLVDLFDIVVVSEEFGSEKPNLNNYKVFEKYNADRYYYIGDNIKKDFFAPNILGWETICLIDSGYNVHKQNFSIDKKYLPKYFVNEIIEIESFLE